jgi:hypothetical protein
MAVVPFPADTWTWESARGLSRAVLAQPRGAEEAGGGSVEDRLVAVEQRLQALEESPPGPV